MRNFLFACLLSVGAVPGWAFAAPGGPTYTAGPQALPYASGAPKTFRSGIIPARHLAKFQAASSPTVCAIGDSTWSQADYVSPFDGLGQKIQQRLREDYPEKTITFKDFSIGGTSLSQFTTVLTLGSYPAWYTNHSATWASYVAAAGCTTLFINFGVNDTGNQTAATYATVFANIVSYSTIPDIILITNAVANPAAGYPYNQPGYQAGYLSNPALMRSIAYSGINLGASGLPPIGIIDVGRYFSMSVQGLDPENQIFQWSVYPGAPITVTTFPYSPPTTPGGDYDLNMTFSNGSGWVSAAASASVNLGGALVNNGFVNIVPNGGTNIYVQYYYGNGGANINSNTNNWSTGNNTIEVIARGARVLVYVNGALSIDLILPRAVAILSPTIIFGNAPTGGTILTVNSYAISVPRAYVPTVSAANCYGSLTGISSGNGINHDSSVCLNAVYREVLEATTFR